MKPARSLLDPAFRYTSSVKTDLRKTFARIRREQEKQRSAAATVTTIPKRKAS